MRAMQEVLSEHNPMTKFCCFICIFTYALSTVAQDRRHHHHQQQQLQQQQRHSPDHENTGTAFDEKDVQSICEKDQFVAKCPRDEVILITYARYGRMRTGSCVTGSGGTIGCSADVLLVLDAVCSGRRHCDVSVASLMRGMEEPCNADYRSYLEVSHRCVKVAYIDESTCQSAGAIELRLSIGYISNFITEETGCGSTESPWWVTVSPGQRIRLTLLDFGIHTLTHASSSSSLSPVCHVYAVIKDVDTKRSETVCGGGILNSREQVVYTSTGRLVEVRVTKGHLRKQPVAAGKTATYFLLKYEAVGCADPPVPRHGWMRRTETGFDLGCNGSQDGSRVWQMRCQGTQWTGTAPNCSEEVLDSQVPWTSVGNASLTSFVLILAIAVFVGVIILLGGLFYLRRKETVIRRSSHAGSLVLRDTKQSIVSCGGGVGGPGSYDFAGQYVVGSSSCATNDYFHAALPPELDRGGPGRPSMGGGGTFSTPFGFDRTECFDLNRSGDDYDHQQTRYVEHIYDSPKFNRRKSRDVDAMTLASSAGELPVPLAPSAVEGDGGSDFRDAIY